MPFQIEKPYMSIHARVRRTCGQKLFHDAQIIEYFQRSRLHSLASGSREWFGALVDDSQGHPATGKVAGKRKTRRPRADDDDVGVAGVGGGTGMPRFCRGGSSPPTPPPAIPRARPYNCRALPTPPADRW